MKKINLLIVEDNRLLREGILSLVEGQKDIRAGTALGTNDKILEKMRSFKPGVLLLDLGLAGQNSLQLVKAVKLSSAETNVIVMDLIPLQTDVLEFVRAGVSGFILKDATIEDFLKTIRSVAYGAQVLPPQLTGSLFSQIVINAVHKAKRTSATLNESIRMTKREKQVIELISDGMTNKEIAHKLNLSTYTIKSHVHNILEKLTLHTRVQIAKYVHTSKTVDDVSNTISLINE